MNVTFDINIFILGDMNVCVNKWNEKDYYLKKVAEEYQSILGKNGLELIDFGITWQRLQENGIVKESALDHLLSNHLSSISDQKKVYVTFSDHCAIVTDIIARKQKVKKLQISRDMRKIRAHPAKFIQELSNINWNTIYENEDMDVDDMVKYWSDNIIKVLDKLAEKKSRQIRS